MVAKWSSVVNHVHESNEFPTSLHPTLTGEEANDWLKPNYINSFLDLLFKEVMIAPEKYQDLLASVPVPPLECVRFVSFSVAVCIIFSIMACFYTFTDPAEIETQFKKKVHEDDEDDRSQ
eukprot:superscaffoldBa00002056_g13018